MTAKKSFTLVLLFMMLTLFAGCSSVRLFYNNADLLLRTKATSYFALTAEQITDFNVHFTRLHDWHRQQELPHYAMLLQTAGEKLADGLTREEVDWLMTVSQVRFRVLAEQTAEDMAPILVTLNSAQLQMLEKRLAEDNTKFAKKYLIGNEDRRRQVRVDQMAELFSDWIGKLSPQQEQLIAHTVSKFPGFHDLRFQERQHWQQAFIALLRKNPEEPVLREKLRAFLGDWETPLSEEYIRTRQAYREGIVQLILDLDRTLTSAQRLQAVQRLANFASDFRILATERTVASRQ
jgi:hypothetical protein